MKLWELRFRVTPKPECNATGIHTLVADHVTGELIADWPAMDQIDLPAGDGDTVRHLPDLDRNIPCRTHAPGRLESCRRWPDIEGNRTSLTANQQDSPPRPCQTIVCHRLTSGGCQDMVHSIVAYTNADRYAE
jgi:hypothetical protein